MNASSTASEVLVAEIIKRREHNGTSQQAVADALRARGFSNFYQTNYSRIEKFQRKVNLDEAVVLADLFDIDLGAIVRDARDSTGLSIVRQRLRALDQEAQRLRATLSDGADS